MATSYKHLLFVGRIQIISYRVTGLWWQITPNDKCRVCLCAFFKTWYSTLHLSCPLSSSLSIPLPLSLCLYLSAIRQIVAGLICIMSPTVPIGAPHSCLLKDSGATAPSHSAIPWIKLTLGQHQHIMNYGHLPLQTHCSLCSNVKNIEGTGELRLLTAYSLSYLLCGVRLWKVDGGTALRCEAVHHPIGMAYFSCVLTFTQNSNVLYGAEVTCAVLQKYKLKKVIRTVHKEQAVFKRKPGSKLFHSHCDVSSIS